MDGDPFVEPELDTLGLFLPLPFRVAIILVLGTPLGHIPWFNLTLSRRLGLGRESPLSTPLKHRSCPYIPSSPLLLTLT